MLRIGPLTLLAALVMLASCSDSGTSEYQDAAAVAEALNEGGVVCNFSSSPTLDGGTGGVCDGAGFTVIIHVLASAADREEIAGVAIEDACAAGVEGSLVVGERWIVGFGEFNEESHTISELADATNGDLLPLRCDN